MAQAGGYRDELEIEHNKTDPNSHASRLIKQEIERLNKGEDEVPQKKGHQPHLELHVEKPQRVTAKIRLPVKEHPRYNFVGKLLGPGGSTLKSLQEETGCKLAIMGRGSVRDKEKEEEQRKMGGKYAHLEEDLHILVECYSDVRDAYHRIAEATIILKKFCIPQIQEDYYEGEGGMGPSMNGGGRGRGAYRGGPPAERGGRGAGFRGGRGAGPPPPPGRGGRGGPPSRGAPRGAGRGAPPPLRGGGRGAASSGSYDGYGSQYSSGGYDSGYDGYGGGQNYSSGSESQYYDYGHSSGQASGYDSYSGYDYGDSWGSGGGKASTPSGRGSSRGQARSHPYQRSSGGGY